MRAFATHKGAQALRAASKDGTTLAALQGWCSRSAYAVSNIYTRHLARFVHSSAQVAVVASVSVPESQEPLRPQEGCICGLLACNPQRCPAQNYNEWETESSASKVHLAPYLASDWSSTEAILERVGFRPGQKLLDVGAGDGRVLLQAAHRGASFAQGFELNGDVFLLGRDHIASGVRPSWGPVELVHGDGLAGADFSSFDIIFAFLVPQGLKLLGRQLQILEEEALRVPEEACGYVRVVTRGWCLPQTTLQASQTDQFTLPGGSPVYVYRVKCVRSTC
jgi:hypothetical protein